MRLREALSGALVALVFAGSSPPRLAAQIAEGTIEVPFVSQGDLGLNFRCGGAAVAMVRRYFGDRSAAPADLDPLVDERSGGVTTRDLVQDLVSRGYRVTPGGADWRSTRSALQEGWPVIALIGPQDTELHYVVIVDAGDSIVTFHDPARGPYQRRTRTGFDEQWRQSGRWAVAIEKDDPTGWAQESNGYADRPLEREMEAQAISVFLDGDRERALALFERAGGLEVSEIELRGARTAPHDGLVAMTGLHIGVRLTPRALVQARRRLSLLPTSMASDLRYVPRAGGYTEVEGALLERPLAPTRVDLAVQAARATWEHEVTLGIYGALRRGESVGGLVRWEEGRRAAALQAAIPILRPGFPSVVSLEAGYWSESHLVPDSIEPTLSEMRSVTLEAEDWVRSDVRAALKLGLTRWEEGVQPHFGGEVEWIIRGATRVSGSGHVWPRTYSSSDSFLTASVDMRWARTLQRETSVSFLRGWMPSLRLGASWASPRTPRILWPGAGTGRARPTLLRAHPLLSRGTIRSDRAFGRTLTHAGAELQTPSARWSLFSVAFAGFLDYARSTNDTGNPLAEVRFEGLDVGAGLRLGLAGKGTLRSDYAVGLLDGRSRLSFGFSPS